MPVTRMMQSTFIAVSGALAQCNTSQRYKTCMCEKRPEITSPWSAEHLGFTVIGEIIGAHGVHGEVRVKSASDFAKNRLCIEGRRYLRRRGRVYPRPVNVCGGRKASQIDTYILRIANVASRDDAFALRGASIYVRDGDRPRLRKEEFLVSDLVGLDVRVVDTLENVGVVKAVITRDELCAASGGGKNAAAVASDLLEIALTTNTQHVDYHLERNRIAPSNVDVDYLESEKCVLIPFVPQIVPTVDIENGRIELDPPPGLLDIAVVNRKTKPRPPLGLLMPAASTVTQRVKVKQE